jgi:hypothetical protein
MTPTNTPSNQSSISRETASETTTDRPEQQVWEDDGGMDPGRVKANFSDSTDHDAHRAKGHCQGGSSSLLHWRECVARHPAASLAAAAAAGYLLSLCHRR